MNDRAGFIAISSVLVLSAIFLVLAIGMSQREILTSEGALTLRHGSAAHAAARACAEYALMELTRALEYTGGESRTVGAHSCTVEPFVLADDGTATIRTHATVSGHTQRVIVEVSAVVPDVTITSYRAVDDF